MTEQLLRPSAYERWSKCAAAPRRELKEPATTNSAASEGTRLHALAAKHIDEFLSTGKKPVIDTAVVEEYVYSLIDTYRIGSAQFAKTELTVNLQSWIGPEGSTMDVKGTADFVAYIDGRLEVHDFKSGRTEVFAYRNGQLGLYALGVAELLLSVGIDVDTIVVVIHQPVAKSQPDEWVVTIEELQSFGSEIRKSANAVLLTPSPKATPGEDQCRWCRHAWRCKELAEYVDKQLDNTDTAIDALGERFVALPIIETYVKIVTEAVEDHWRRGIPIPHTRYVIGRAGNRAWVDSPEREIASAITSYGFEQDALFTTALKSPAEIERLFKKEKKLTEFAELSTRLISRAEGKAKVVLDTPANAKYEDYIGDTTGFGPIED